MALVSKRRRTKSCCLMPGSVHHETMSICPDDLPRQTYSKPLFKFPVILGLKRETFSKAYMSVTKQFVSKLQVVTQCWDRVLLYIPIRKVGSFSPEILSGWTGLHAETRVAIYKEFCPWGPSALARGHRTRGILLALQNFVFICYEHL